MSRFLAVVIALFCSTAFALNIEEPLPDAAKESQARALFREIRCVVCQGESLADSPADIAVGMRHEIRRLVAEGKDRDEIIAYFTSRYGDGILMQTPFTAATALLWLSPLLILLLAIFLAARYFKGKSSA